MTHSKLIKTKADYAAALARIDELIDGDLKVRAQELELLSTLVELYERKVHPMDPPDPVEAIRFRMDQSGLRREDLVSYIGSRSKVSEVLSGTRPLSLRMIRNLHAGLGIPADVLLQPRVATRAKRAGILPSFRQNHPEIR